MAGLDDIINLTITIESSSVTRAGFGTPLVVDYNTRFSDVRVRPYSSTKGMTDDGFVTSDEGYKAVAAMLSQNPRPAAVKLGRRTLPPAQVFEFAPATAASTLYKFQMAITGGAFQTVEFLSSATADSAEILNGLTAAVAALNGYGAAALTAATSAGKVTISGPASGAKFDIKTVNANFSSYGDAGADAGIATDLNAIELEDDDWYALMSTAKNTAEQASAASWTQTRRKFFVAATMNSDVKASGSVDIGSTLKASGYTRTALVWNDSHMTHIDAALLGKWLPYTPGSETVKFKTLAGQTATRLTDSELAQLRAKNVNHYISVAGVSMLAEGKTCQGEYMDVIRFVDWLYANIQEEIFEVLTLETKVPFTDPGIGQIESAIRAVLQRGVQAGGLSADPQFTVTVPKAANVSTANKSARTLPSVSFAATLAGAIHAVTINGTVSV
jgi:hypothetical protein